MKKLILLLCLVISANLIRASHIAGGDLTYNCIGPNQYQINLNLFVDCLGFDPGNAQTISFTSTCGGNTTTTVNCTNPGGTEISQLCPSQISNSTCSGGTLPGMWVFHYTGTVTLAPPCDTWTMSWTVCCRNGAIVNLVNPASVGSYIQATINTVTNPCNNSPSFNAQPIPYVCINQLVNYSYGVVESDGDSLYFSFINAMDAGATMLAYSPGYSATSPIPGITLNPSTGLLSFTPTMLGNFVVVVMVQEYDHSGNLLGTTMRDIQFIVQNCSNIVPDASAGAITGLTGTAVQSGPFAIEMCEGANFTFNATYTDVNAGDILTLTSTLAAAMPGATITTSGTNPVTATISWTAPGGSAGSNATFSVTVNDGACPVQGQQTFVYDITVNPRTLGGPDQTICGSQTATLNGTGGSIFTWSVLSGPPMVVGTNFSCNPCANPVASPVSTTVYQVQSDLSGTCVNRDTITITVVPDYSFTVSQSSSTTCLQQPIQLNVTPTPNTSGYTYSWSPGTYLSNTNTSNPVATITNPGTYTYTVTVTSPQGCVKTDVVTITATPNYPPNAIAFTSDPSVCDGETVNLGVTFGSSVPATCGTTPVMCSGGTVTQVGTGTGANTTTSYPAPYGNWWSSVKHQFLFRASELTAAGISGGKIDRLDFNVSAINGISTYHQYTIKMGCTSVNSLTTWISGLQTVYLPKTFNVSTGWNQHPFDNAFLWDGISNVVVEICFNEMPPSPSYTYNCISPFTTTTYNSSIYIVSDATPQCPVTTTPTTLTQRPNVRFRHCGAAPDSTNYVYTWTPSTGVGNPNSQFTNATVNSSTTYTVIVTDNTSGCADSAVVTVNSSSPNVSFTATPTSGFHPLTVNFTNTSSPSVVTYLWNFGDTLSGVDNTSTLINPTHVYNTEGQYIVTLIGIDANGCTDTATILIDVNNTSILIIPNVFTPGGTNPLFKVTGFAISNYSIQIFDRWGKKKFESNDINNSWDGDNASDGTYYYLIKAKGVDNKDYDEKGWLQLIRVK
jgi:PKD repeat protein